MYLTFAGAIGPNNPSVAGLPGGAIGWLVPRAKTRGLDPLIWSICRRYQLTSADAGDVGQKVWLQLVTQLNHIRDPAAIPGWLATTTHRECCSIQRAARRWQPLGGVLDAGHIPGPRAGEAEHELLEAERHAALHEAFTRLPAGWQQLIAALTEDPPEPYAQISAQLGIPVGSIVPMRNRCLDTLRRDPAIAALNSAEDPSARGELSRQTAVP